MTEHDAPTWDAYHAASRALDEWHERRRAALAALDDIATVAPEVATVGEDWFEQMRDLLEEPIPAAEGPDDGHTFEIETRSRGSYITLGDTGHSDADDWGSNGAVEVRAWSLREALVKAASLPLDAWPGLVNDEPSEAAPVEVNTPELRWHISRLLQRQLAPSIGRYRTTRIAGLIFKLLDDASAAPTPAEAVDV